MRWEGERPTRRKCKRQRPQNENTVWTDSRDYGATMYLSTENVKKSLLWLSPLSLSGFYPKQIYPRSYADRCAYSGVISRIGCNV